MTTDEGPHRGHRAEKGSLCVTGWQRESPLALQDAGIRRFQGTLEGERHGFKVQRGAV